MREMQEISLFLCKIYNVQTVQKFAVASVSDLPINMPSVVHQQIKRGVLKTHKKNK
jgi:hypothetical protein